MHACGACSISPPTLRPSARTSPRILRSLPGLGDEFTHGIDLLRPLSPAKIREAIVGPAQAKGVAFESVSLVEHLVTSTARPEGLPLLQFALAELWEARPPPSQNVRL